MEKGELLKKIKARFTRDNCLILILTGVLFLVILWPVEKDKKKEEQSLQWDSETDILNLYSDTGRPEADPEETMGEEAAASYRATLERSLERLLGTMEGAGRVRVMVTLRDSGEAVVEKDENRQRSGTTEVDSAGGSRNTTSISDEAQTIYQNGQGSGSSPYVRQVLAPRVEGVVISAEGGGNPEIVRDITEAIQALFGVEAHKIKIVKMTPQ